MGILLVIMIISFASTVFFMIEGFIEMLDDSKSIASVVLCFISIVICIASIIITNIGQMNLEKTKWSIEDKPYSIEYITTLQDCNLTNGRFYARRGYINEDLYYQYIVKKSDGGYVANKVKANNATIYISDDSYRVEWYKQYKHWWFFKEEQNAQKIYLPNNSIKEDCNIDLK